MVVGQRKSRRALPAYLQSFVCARALPYIYTTLADRRCTTSCSSFSLIQLLQIIHMQSHQLGVFDSFGAKFQTRCFFDGRSLAAVPKMIGREHFPQPPIVETRFNNHFAFTMQLSLILWTSLLGSSLEEFAPDDGFVRAKHATLSVLFSPPIHS